MKVLHLTTGLGDGGAESVMFRLVQASPDIDHLIVSLSIGGKYKKELEDLGVEVIELNLRRRFWGFVGLRKLLVVVSSFKPDVVQSWMDHANLLAGLYGLLEPGLPIFWGVRKTDLMVGVDPWHTRLASSICAGLSPGVPKAIVYAGRKSMELHQKSGYAANKGIVIPNGYDLDRFVPNLDSRQAVRSSLEIPPRAFVLGSVGRFAPQKDQSGLLEALAIAEIPRETLHCLLVGEKMGPDNQALVGLADSLGLSENLHFLGPRNDIEKFMNAMDVHVTSSSYGESFPNVVCESMACGNPCVATDVGDAAFILGQTGFLARPQDVKSLAATITQAYQAYLEGETWLIRRLEARRRIEENFSLEKMVRDYTALWEGYVESLNE